MPSGRCLSSEEVRKESADDDEGVDHSGDCCSTCLVRNQVHEDDDEARSYHSFHRSNMLDGVAEGHAVDMREAHHVVDMGEDGGYWMVVHTGNDHSMGLQKDSHSKDRNLQERSLTAEDLSAPSEVLNNLGDWDLQGDWHHVNASG